MKDFEIALREVLVAHAAAAERPVELLGGVRLRARQLRLRRRTTVLATMVVVGCALAVAAVVPLSIAVLSSIRGPDSGPSLPTPARSGSSESDHLVTPPGWSPVTYGDLQVSVPGSWPVLSARTGCGTRAAGTVYVGGSLKSAVSLKRTCDKSANVVELIPDPGAGAITGIVSKVNGIAVLPEPAQAGLLRYVALPLGVEVAASGPKARQILGTLTRSPLAVVLGPGRRTPVPASWRWHAFGGIKFAAPASWPTVPDKVWGWCGNGVPDQLVELNTARGDAILYCPDLAYDAKLQAGHLGIQVGAGPAAGQLTGPAAISCARSRGLRICVQPPYGDEAVLTVSALPPGYSRPTIVLIGLAGDGEQARAIFDSIQAAGRR
jgi:hypothetical protein